MGEKVFRDYDENGRGTTTRIIEHKDGSRVERSYESHHMIANLHSQDGPTTTKKFDSKGKRIK